MPRSLLQHSSTNFRIRMLSQAESQALMHRVPGWSERHNAALVELRGIAQQLPFLRRHELAEVQPHRAFGGHPYRFLVDGDEAVILDGTAAPWCCMEAAGGLGVEADSAAHYVRTRFNDEERAEFTLAESGADLVWPGDTPAPERARISAMMQPPTLERVLPDGRFCVVVIAIRTGALCRFRVYVGADGGWEEQTEPWEILAEPLRVRPFTSW